MSTEGSDAGTQDFLQLLSYGIGHEFAQPLAAIRMTLATIDADDPELVEPEQIMSAAVALMQDRVSDLTTLVRLAMDQPLASGRASLTPCADAVMREPGSSGRCGRADVAVEGEPVVSGDPDALSLATRGLIRTALKLCGDPPVRMAADSADGFEGVSVRYFGPHPRKTFDISAAELIAKKHGGRLDIATVDGATTLRLLVPGA